MIKAMIICSLGIQTGGLWAQFYPAPKPSRASDTAIFWSDGQTALHHPDPLPKKPLGYALAKTKSNLRTPQNLLAKGLRAPVAGTFDLDYLLVPIESEAELGQLAAIAHAATGMCGSIEFLPLDHAISTVIIPSAPIYSSRSYFPALQTLIDLVQLATIDQFISVITSLPSRYAFHPQGETAHTTIRQLWESQLKSNRWTITERSHAISLQKSIVARLPGGKKADETIIIGAHLDSIVSRSGNSKTDPSAGADDDASGLAILTEVLRLIELENLQFDRSIELHAYAAEEVGLVGSREIASSYAEEGRKIAGMLQLDMAYFSLPGSQGIIHLLEEFTSRDLTRSAIDWLRSYLGQIYKIGNIPKGSASDHKSFWEKGYPTLFPFEDPVHYNPHIHTANDTKANFDDGLLIKRITQLALLFLSYQGGLTSLASTYAGLQEKNLPAEIKQKLPLAIQTAGDGYYLAVAAPIAAATVEFCVISEGNSQFCLAERAVLNKNNAMGILKTFYSASSWNFAVGQRWRILVYDEKDELIAWNQVELSAP